jgi:hypothetical protein
MGNPLIPPFFEKPWNDSNHSYGASWQRWLTAIGKALLPGQLPGTNTNDNAAPGMVGEYITATGTAVSLTTVTPTNVTSISLTPGDWEVAGSFAFNPAGSTVLQAEDVGISTVSATFPAAPFLFFDNSAKAAGASDGGVVPTQRISVASTTTVYLVAYAAFTVSTCTITGNIQARRIR